MRTNVGILLATLLAAAACENTSTLPVGPGGPSAPKGVLGQTGAHFTLNILGVKDKQHEMDATNGNGIGSRIFVQLYGGDDEAWLDTQLLTQAISRVNKIFLQPGPDFAVLDANATDQKGADDGALFQMPSDISSTSYDSTGSTASSTTYRVVARFLGKPDGHVDMASCGTVLLEDGTEDIECSLGENVVSETRTKGKPVTVEVTDQLLFVHDVTLDPDYAGSDCSLNTPGVDDPTVTVDKMALFDPCLQTVFWNYENNGLKLTQLRFYPVE